MNLHVSRFSTQYVLGWFICRQRKPAQRVPPCPPQAGVWVIGLDVRRDDERAMPGPRMGRGGGMGEVWVGEPVPGQREVEGRGGAFWYEVPH